MQKLLPFTNVWDDQGMLHYETYYGTERFNLTMDYASSMVYTMAFDSINHHLRALEAMPDAQNYKVGLKGQLDGVKGLEKRLSFDDDLPWFDANDRFVPETSEGGVNRWAFVHHHWTDRTSGAVHWNGDNKNQAVPRTWYRMYWATGGSRGTDLRVMQEVVRKGKVTVGETGEELSWDKVCGKYGLAGEHQW